MDIADSHTSRNGEVKKGIFTAFHIHLAKSFKHEINLLSHVWHVLHLLLQEWYGQSSERSWYNLRMRGGGFLHETQEKNKISLQLYYHINKPYLQLPLVQSHMEGKTPTLLNPTLLEGQSNHCCDHMTQAQTAILHLQSLRETHAVRY